MVDHIAYEAAALEISVDRWDKTTLPEDRRFVFEAAVLHVRLLRDFFWGTWKKESERFKKSSVYAEDYFPDRLYWSGRKGPLPATLCDTKDAIDKQLAHVCRERSDSAFTKDLETHLPKLRDELLEEWTEFIEALNGPASGGVHGAKLEDERTKWLKTLRP
jgi:hypothetical protein